MTFSTHSDDSTQSTSSGTDAPRHDNNVSRANLNTIAQEMKPEQYPFAALELIHPTEPATSHYSHHALESFYWVFLWVVLRHTKGYRHKTGTPGQQLCAELFSGDSIDSALDSRFNWPFRKLWIDIVDNAPLTALVTEFSQLLPPHIAATLGSMGESYLTYDATLEVFSGALKMEGWPESDWIPYKPGEAQPRARPAAVPIMCDVPPGYPVVPLEGRVLRSHARGWKPYVPQGVFGARVPAASTQRELQPVIGPKRPLSQEGRVSDLAEASGRQSKKLKPTVDSLAAPDTMLRLSETTGSVTRLGGRSRGGALPLQLSRRSARLAAAAEKKALEHGQSA